MIGLCFRSGACYARAQQAKGKEVIGMLENPATTPSDLLLLRKELELLEKENALLTVKEKAARLGVEV